MDKLIENSLVFITNTINEICGTGFIFKHDENGSHILTCAHVIENMGEKNI